MSPPADWVNVAEPTLRALEADPRRLAVCEPGGRRVSHGELHRRAVALAESLRADGLRPGDRVLLVAPNGVELAAAALAVLLAGGVLVLCETGLGDAVYLSRVRAAAPRWLLVHPLVLWANRLPPARKFLRRFEIDIPPLPTGARGPVRRTLSRGLLDRLAAAPAGPTFRPTLRAPGDDAVIAFTGGTTGRPRGVRLGHGALGHYLARLAAVTSGLRAECFLADTPQQVLYVLRLGRSAYVTRGRRLERARHALRLIRSGAIDSCFSAPELWMRLLDLVGPRGGRLPDTLRTVLLGGAPVTGDFLRGLLDGLHPGTRVLSLYGLTEVGAVCAATAAQKLAWDGPGDLVGTPLPGVRLEVVSPDADGVGEVVVRSPSLYGGYLGEEARPTGEGLRTGDLGYLVEKDGGPVLALAGRTRDMIIRRGVNLYPGVLEPVLCRLRDGHGPLVRQCALVGVWNDSRQDEDAVLCVEAPAGRPAPSPRGLLRRAAEAVGPDGAPDRVLILRALPVTGRQNKIDRVALRALAEAARGPAPRSAPARETGGARLPGARVPFDFVTFFRKYRAQWRAEGGPVRVAVTVALRLALFGVVQAGWAWDEIARYRWRDGAMRGPLFILGHQRSGTTLLHRLLTTDSPHTRALKLHEMLLPAVGLQRLLGALAALDRLVGGPLRACLDRLQGRLLGPLDDLHRIRFDEIEEDEFALWAIHASAMCANDSPAAAALPELDGLRHFDEWPARRRSEALGWYRACLLKKVYREPGGAAGPPWVVAKNPAFTQKVLHLRRAFPGCRFVYLYRTPREAIPSRLGLVRAVWRRRRPGFRDMTAEQVEAIYRDSVRTYLAAERDLPGLPPEVALTVRYADLVAAPGETADKIAAHFGVPGGAAAGPPARRATGSTGPRHGLAEFGLDEARLRRDLAEVFARHGEE